MSTTFSLPKEKAMALGGVATGNIHANQAEIVCNWQHQAQGILSNGLSIQ